MMETLKKKWHILLYSLTCDKVESPHKKAERQRGKKKFKALIKTDDILSQLIVG